MSHSTLTKIRTDHSPNQMLNYYTSTAKVTTRQLQQRIFPPALTNDFHSCPPTKHHLIRPPLLTRKLSTKADTSSPCNMNPKHLFLHEKHCSPLFFLFVRLIICPSSFLQLCLFGRHRPSHHCGEACLIAPRAIWL